jgi:outer membrane protein TolC
MPFLLPLICRFGIVTRGNIKAAQFQIEASKQLQSQAELEVRNEISTAYKQLLETDRLYKTGFA